MRVIALRVSVKNACYVMLPQFVAVNRLEDAVAALVGILGVNFGEPSTWKVLVCMPLPRRARAPAYRSPWGSNQTELTAANATIAAKTSQAVHRQSLPV